MASTVSNGNDRLRKGNLHRRLSSVSIIGMREHVLFVLETFERIQTLKTAQIDRMDINVRISPKYIDLTNRPHFSMVYTLIDHRNDVRKCSKLKWNHEPLGEWFHCKVLDI